MFGVKGKESMLNIVLKENERLVRENNALRDKIKSIENYLGEYSSIVDEITEYRDEYAKQIQVIKDLEKEYRKELDKLIK